MKNRLIKITPDKEKAKSLMNMATKRQEMMSTLNSSKYPSLIVERYYEIITELISSILMLDGYKIKCDGAHKALIEYIGDTYNTKFQKSDIYFLDELRLIRNKINYNGFFVKTDYLTRNEKNINEIILKLEELINQKMIPTKNTETAGGIVVNDSKVVVVSQRGTSWSLPKGHIEPGEDKLQAAIREIEEETGITELKLIKDLGSYKRYRIGKNPKEVDTTELKTIHIFLFETDQTKLRPTDPHNPEAKWIQKEKVSELLTHPKDKEFYLKVVKKI
ncbi:MAG: NUDIX domain-containing protein [DPANN group archaeon]|nr:NUDIX domain-containing protein [DPANN group archaeon]